MMPGVDRLRQGWWTGQQRHRRPMHRKPRVEAVLFIKDLEQWAPVVDRFGGAKKQQALGLQSKMEQIKHPLLSLVIEVNEQVATRNQIKVRKGRVFKHIMMGEKHRFTQASVNPVTTVLP